MDKHFTLSTGETVVHYGVEKPVDENGISLSVQKITEDFPFIEADYEYVRHIGTLPVFKLKETWE